MKLWSIFLLIIAALLCFRLIKSWSAKRKMIVGVILSIIVIALCITFCVNYFVMYNKFYAILVPGSIPIDLEANHTAALSSDPYVREGVLEIVPGISTPPVFAFIRLSTFILGTDYQTYEQGYRLLWVILSLFIAAGLIVYTVRNRYGVAPKNFITSKDQQINVFRNPMLYASLAIVFLLVFVMSEILDWFSGNTAFFVTTLVVMQVLLHGRDSHFSRFLQGFLLAVAWWFKPNISLVLLLFFVFSVKRKEHAYWIGMVTSVLVVSVVSLMSPNVSLGTYYKFFFEVSKTIQTTWLGSSGNLSFLRIGLFQACSDSAYILAFFLFAIIIVVFTGRGKSNLIEQEIPVLLLTVIPWPILWGIYFSWVAVALYLWIVQRLKEGKTVYLEMIFISFLSWFSFASFNPLGTNCTLVMLLFLYYKDNLFAKIGK